MAWESGMGNMLRISCWSGDLKERKESSGARVSMVCDRKTNPLLKLWMMVGNLGWCRTWAMLGVKLEKMGM